MCFSYEPGKPTIRDFSLTVPAGKKVALVGATGSGKTTIVNLLMRFYNIDKGQIFINDQNIQDIAKNSLRQNIAIAHRLSTVRDSDMIVVMDQGRIVESGTHDDLLARKGKYYELYTMQYAGYAT